MTTTTTDVELVQLRILADPADWSGVFDQVEVWRSKVGPQGPFDELTGSSWLAARVPQDAADEPLYPAPVVPSVALDGLELNLQVDGYQDFVVAFSSVGPMSYADAAAFIDSVGSGKFTAYVTQDAAFVIEGVRPGAGATLEVTGGDAAPLLGLAIDSPDNYGRGKDARIALVSGKEAYDFSDTLGSRDYYYKTRFRNSTTKAVSEFSAPFLAGRSLGITPANIVVGYLDMVRGDGTPSPNLLVQLHSSTQTALVEGRLVAGASQAKLSDADGHVEFSMVRGVSYTVSIASTDVVRDVLAPVDPATLTFNMLGGGSSIVNDAFKVQVPDIVYAERRSL